MKFRDNLRLAAVTALLAVTACATAPDDPAQRAEFEAQNDPLEPMNRAIFDFNLAVDKAVLKPVARGYRDTVPKDARTSIRNVFDNAGEPITFMNQVLQGKPGPAAETFTRFWFNSTVGFLGLFDAAGQYGLGRVNEDFGQTLGVWGFGEGPFLMLPLLGPSNLRDAIGLGVDSAANPYSYIATSTTATLARLGTRVVDGVDQRSRNIETLDEIEKNALDFYATLRSLYRQNRENEIRDGVPSDDLEVPEIDVDE